MSPQIHCPDCGKPKKSDTCSCGHRFFWRRSFGKKGLNRVTVYERSHGGPLQIMHWTKGKSCRESLINLDGTAIYDRADAWRSQNTSPTGSGSLAEARRSPLYLVSLTATRSRPSSHNYTMTENRSGP